MLCGKKQMQKKNGLYVKARQFRNEPPVCWDVVIVWEDGHESVALNQPTRDEAFKSMLNYWALWFNKA